MSQSVAPPRPLEGVALALLTLALSMATFMQVLDSTIANVAIPTIAGNLGAERLCEFFFQKQTRRNNRQIHKLSILKGGIRKRNQAPFEVKGFRLFDKVACQGEEGFIFGRRSTGYFDVRKLDGTCISAGISYKKLHLLEKRRTYLTEIRKEEALPPLPEGRGSAPKCDE